jgi:putative hemolysin
LKLFGLFISSIASAIFSSMEMLLNRLRREEVKEIVDKGGSDADRVTDYLRNPRKYLGTAFIIKGCCLVISTILCFLLFRPIVASPIYGNLISFVIASALIVLLGEIVPYNYSKNREVNSVIRAISVLRFSYIIFYPLIKPFLWGSDVMIKAFGGNPRQSKGMISEEDLEALQMVADSDEVLEEEEREMIHRIWELPDTLVHEIMVPRTEMVCLDVNADIKKVLDVAVESGHSRIPVYQDTIDNIIGVLYVKDLLRCWRDGISQVNLAEVIREPFFVPEMKNVKDLFRELRFSKRHIAIVVDEYGGTAGIVTLEDILEEIVGDIQDEYDLEEKRFQKLDENSYAVDARMDLHEVNETLGIELPADEVESIGGLLVELLGRVPDPGDEAEYGGVKFTVLEADERKVIRVRIDMPRKDDEESDN